MSRCWLSLFLLLVFSTPSLASNGYQETMNWWRDVSQNASQFTMILQDIYAEAERQVGPDKSKLDQSFSKRLAQRYPGSVYYSRSVGTLVPNNYTTVTFDSSWKILIVRQTIGGIQKTYNFRDQTVEVANGPNRVAFKVDLARSNRPQFTMVDIPAISATAHQIWAKKGLRQGLFQPLKEVLNDAYSNTISATGTRMDALAEGMITDEGVREYVLDIADSLYSAPANTPQQVIRPNTSGNVAPQANANHSQKKPRTSLFSFLPWYFWPGIIILGATNVFLSNNKKRKRIKRNRDRYGSDDFSMSGERRRSNGGKRRSSPDDWEMGPLPNSETSPIAEAKPQEWSLHVLTSLEWKRFETVCAEYFRRIGFEPRETRIGADGGVDIWLYEPGKKTPVGIVQCKAWSTIKVGVKPVRELYGVVKAEEVPRGWFYTSGDFTSEALAFAEAKELELVTGDRFLKDILALPADKQQELLDIALEGDYKTPTCPQCGVKMIKRKGAEGQRDFWGCPRYPRCRATLVRKKD